MVDCCFCLCLKVWKLFILGVDFVDKMHKAAKELENNSGYQAKNITSCTNTIAQASTGSYIPNYQ